MGCRLSQPDRRPSSADPSSTSQSSAGSTATDLMSYESACRADLDLQTFDSILQNHTSRAILSIYVDSDKRSVSLESLGRSMESLLDMNEAGVKLILENKKDIWKSKELSDFVNDYFESSLDTLSFCTELDACLISASRIELILNVAIRKFQEEHDSSVEPRVYSRTLEELRNFQAAESPFTQEFFSVFNSARARQQLMLERLKTKKRKLDRKLGKLKAWRRVSNVIFAVAFASILVFSVVAAAVSAPPVVTAVAAAAAVPVAPMGKWMNSMWKKFEKAVIWQKEMVESFELSTFCVIQELNSIGACVARFEVEIKAVAASAEFAKREDEAVVIAMNEIKKQVKGFFETIQELRKHANKCTESTTQARAVILKRIISHPRGGGESGLSGMLPW